mmetsp:Transcript_99178/g.179143  ORF Transcript_99178/g.179143 Transcript_99178/m.179143 type:complete len:176 (-) Transcript_99178:39-566(-)
MAMLVKLVLFVWGCLEDEHTTMISAGHVPATSVAAGVLNVSPARGTSPLWSLEPLDEGCSSEVRLSKRLEAELRRKDAELHASKADCAELEQIIDGLREKLQVFRNRDSLDEAVLLLLAATQDAWWLHTIVGAWKNVVCAQALERICNASFSQSGRTSVEGSARIDAPRIKASPL